MTVLPQLERELLDAHERRAARRQRRVHYWLASHWPSTRAGLLLAGAALILAAGATAASLLVHVSRPIPAAPQPYAIVVKGAPPHVGPTPAEAAQMLREIGRPLQATARVYTLQPDPIGGPGWGLLVYRTSTGTICEHAGRVVDGRVGILDAHNGLHPWTPDPSGCGIGIAMRPVEARGGVLAWGGALSCIPAATPNATYHSGIRVCAASQIRTLIEGVLGPRDQKPYGPRPVSVTITTGADGKFTEATPDGAFLYVTTGGGGFRCRTWPKAIVRYTDGSTAIEPGLAGVAPGCQRATKR